jgi:2-keto-4-pentenoate hydratase/2-oxohepta-3-ene-1,7-dioic acid hydratase in catechol pathway
LRLVRFQVKDNEIQYGVIEEDKIIVIQGDILAQWQKTSDIVPLDEAVLLSPIVPPNILALGKNYSDHAKETKAFFGYSGDIPSKPELFAKATSALNDPNKPILLPPMAPDCVDYEAEMAIVIKKHTKDVTKENALDYVFGYTCVNDISARDCQKTDLQWARGKSFDTFAPLGPWIETELDYRNCDIFCRVNGQVRQSSNTSMMIFDVPFIVSYLSQCMTLLPGTVILSGTPAGCAFAMETPKWLKPGDVVEVEVEGIGILQNPVVYEK